MAFEEVVELRLGGSTVKVMIPDDALDWANTGDRIKLMRKLNERGIGYSRQMTTEFMRKLLKRHEGKHYVKQNTGKCDDPFKGYKVKKCAICGLEFTPLRRNQVYCSKVCMEERRYRIKQISWKQKRVENDKQQSLKFQDMLGEIGEIKQKLKKDVVKNGKK